MRNDSAEQWARIRKHRRQRTQSGAVTFVTASQTALI
jgi:hypothetical protein